MNILISTIHLLGTLCLLIALFFYYKNICIKYTETKIAILIIILILIFGNMSNFLEWFGISQALDTFEDFGSFFVPLLFGMIFYSYSQQNLKDELEESKGRLSAILNNAGVFMVIIDKEYNINWINNMVAEEYGDIKGKKCYSVFKKHLKPCLNCATNLTFKDEKIHSFEEDITLGNGTKIRCLISASPIKNEKNEVYEVLEVIKDITEVNESKAKLEQMMDRLELKNKEMQNFLHITSHDLRSPLVNIIGFTEELIYGFNEIQNVFKNASIEEDAKKKIKKIVDEDILHSIKFVKASISKMNNLINGLLQLSRLSSRTINISPLNMEQMFKEILKDIHYQLIEKNIDLQIIKPIPNCMGDETLINQAFTNLIINAMKYKDPSKNGEIKLYAIEDEEFIDYVVEDNGIGIDESFQTKIFEMFYRINKVNSEGSEGIGLSAVKIILDRQNGIVRLESKMGMGSKFIVSLPKASAE